MNARVLTPAIGVFDSGVGGLTVVRALRQRLPQESIVYLGDTARLPYGTKSAESITRYATQATDHLVSRGIKLLVVACNTASAVSIGPLETRFAPLPVVGVVEPGARAAVSAGGHHHLVLATESTVRRHAYARAIHDLSPEAQVDELPCSLFVALAEEGWTDGPIAEAVARRYLAQVSRPGQAPDTVVLGCTHFPLLADAVRAAVGPGPIIVDSATTTAATVDAVLGGRDLRTTSTDRGRLTLLATDGADRFARVGSRFLGETILPVDVEIVDLWPDLPENPPPVVTPDALPPAPAPDPIETPPPPPPSVIQTVAFEGDGVEYFKIWIVNVLLSIVTIGIYSPWAKVRRLQYFYRNTRLAGASFDYHGQPIAILKGRIIAATMLVAYTGAGALNPVLALAIFAGIALVMPWFLVRSLRFRLHNSSYRGLRFRFEGTTSSAYWVFLGLPILTVMSLFTLFPFWQQRMKRYQYTNASYGRAQFVADPPVGDFYVTYVAAAAMMFVVFVLAAGFLGAGAALAVAASGPIGDARELPAEAAALMVPALAVAGLTYLLGITATQAFVTARLRNLVWNETTVGSCRFASTMRAWPFFRIVITNLVATVLTLGFFWPFAQVRLLRYLASTLAVEGPGSFAEFHAGPDSDVQAVGEEVSEFFDFDIGF